MEKRILKKLQKTELEILNEFVSICEKHNLEYFLAGGTLLGAVRHKGFIPWDDDIDVGMPRKDYNKFIKICKNELNSRFFLDCYETNKYCWSPFAKIRIRNTKMIEDMSKNSKSNQGIWIDIFPYNNIKKQFSKIHKFQQKINDCIRTLITIKLDIPYYNGTEKKKKIIKVCLKFVPIKLLHFIYKGILNININDDMEFMSCYSGSYGMTKETFKSNVFLPLSTVEFCGIKFKAPNKSHDYLTQLYGNYLELPPKEKRITHNPILIKFEDGEEVRYDK